MSDWVQLRESGSGYQSTGAFCGREAGAGTGVLDAKQLAGQAHVVVKQAAVIDWRVFEKFGAATPNAEEFRELRVWSLRADTI